MVIESGPRPLKILFLGANATDTSRLRIGAEFRDIQAEIERARARGEIDIRVEFAVSPVDLNRLLLEYAPDVVHFSGHGTMLRVEEPARPVTTREFEPLDEGFAMTSAKQSAILLETREGKAAPVSTEALVRLFGILRTQRCVVLNACFSAIQAAAITAHVDWVIGMRCAIDDESAIVFAVGFYQAIASGQPLKTAFDLGCSLVSTCGLPGADIPELFGRGDPATVRLVGAGASTATSNPLQVSDVQVAPNCTLDFRVYNAGEVDALINRVSLRAIEARSLSSDVRGYMEYSHEYDLDISSLEKPGEVISCNVAQLVRRQGVDRFGIRLSAKLRPGTYRTWKLRPSLSTNLGTVEGPIVEVVLPPESEASHLRRKEENAKKLAWQKSTPSCLTQYRDVIEEHIDLSPIRETLEAVYPDAAARCLILFEWLGKRVGPWDAGRSPPEHFLLEFPTPVLVNALATHTLTPLQLEGAIRYFAVWRWRPEKFKEPNFWTEELKDMLMEHCVAAGYDADQIREVERLLHRKPKRAPPSHAT